MLHSGLSPSALRSDWYLPYIFPLRGWAYSAARASDPCPGGTCCCIPVQRQPNRAAHAFPCHRALHATGKVRSDTSDSSRRATRIENPRPPAASLPGARLYAPKRIGARLLEVVPNPGSRRFHLPIHNPAWLLRNGICLAAVRQRLSERASQGFPQDGYRVGSIFASLFCLA